MILGLFVLGSLRRPVPSWAALTGLVVGFLVVLAVWLHYPWYAPIGTSVTVVVALAGPPNSGEQRHGQALRAERPEGNGRPPCGAIAFV
jgi:hypothetical protein